MLEYSDERSPWESMEDKLTLIRYAHEQEGQSSEMCFWLLLHLSLTASNVREGELKSNTWQIPKSLYLGDPRSSGFYLKKSCFIIQYYFWRGGKPALLLRELLDWKRKSGQPHPRKRTGSCQQAVELLPAGICTPLIFFFLFIFRDLMRKVVRKVAEKSEWNLVQLKLMETEYGRFFNLQLSFCKCLISHNQWLDGYVTVKIIGRCK